MIAVIIHLRLKIEDRAKISRMFFLLSCEVLPKIAVIRSEIMTSGFNKYVRR